MAWSILRKVLPSNMCDEIRGMRIYKNNEGVIYDVPDDSLTRYAECFNQYQEHNQ